ncbi:MAG: phenylalanine--tRNA ligase subunit beta, partial [Dokdonella sp.]
MKFSENWLRELVAIDVSRAELVERLTMAGLEVESVSELGFGLDGVVVGEIIAAEKHPDADKLQVCKVDIGTGDSLQIVCGAPNARIGLKAPLATVGSNVGGLAIKAAKLRGVESFGMLCSAKELGLDADASGLLELPADAPAGQPLREFLGLPDASIELKLTPNRPDCLGMRGLALEVAAELGSSAHLQESEPVVARNNDRIDVRLEAPVDCPRYCGRLVRGVNPRAESPLWMRERLRRGGIRPISAIVDVTAYVMLETGQPMHAFDSTKIDGRVVVRRARVGEKLTLLDEREVILTDEFVVIADDSKALALGGIMGGFDSRVSDASVDVFLESAHFAPGSIAGRARKLGLHTDASHRFERGVDPDLPGLAIERATRLILDIAGGSAGPVVEAIEPGRLPQRVQVHLRRARLARILGIDVADSEVTCILSTLGMDVITQDDGWLATPPGSRFDIAIEEDLIEEVARLHGYQNIPTQTPRGELALTAPREDRVAVTDMRAQLAARDYAEAITYAFVAADLLEKWGMNTGSVALANPLSGDLAVMRTSLLPGLLAALTANRNRQQTRVRLFEVGRSYRVGDTAPIGTTPVEAAPIETDRIAGVAIGNVDREQWGASRREIDFFDIKGDVESLLALSGSAADEFQFRAGGPTWLHPGRCATVVRDDEVVGHVGALDPRLQKVLDLDDDAYIFELDIATLARRVVPLAGELSRFPTVRRDIAVVLVESIAWSDIETAIRDAVGTVLAKVFVFDRFVDQNLGIGMKSVAIGLILQDRSRTLTDHDADR